MEIKIKLSSELIEKANNGNLKAIDLINFLLDTNKAKNFRGIELKNLSLNKLLVENRIIENAKIDIEEGNLILTLSDEEKEKIEFRKTIITDEEIMVDTESTLYINTKKDNVIDIKNLIEKHSQIVKLCKGQNIKVSYKNKSKKYLQENLNSYLEEVKKDNELFEQLQKGWKNKIEVGLYVGTVEDEELNRLAKIRYEKEKLHYRSSVISRVKFIENEYNQLLTELREENNLYSITL